MVCCTETSSSSSAQDLFTLLSHPQKYMDMTSASKPQPQESTKMKVSLDLPGYGEYLPTYMPGQLITGQLNLQTESPILVTHLRIALFGNVQVYGAGPGYPVSNGLFEYHKNEQLINYGLCIVKQDGQLVCKRDQTDPETKQLKSPQDRHIEKLIRQVASIDHHTTTHLSHGLLKHVPTKYMYQEDTDFELAQQQQVMGFSIRVPTSRRLSGTFHHPHYPVSYRIVALMRYRHRDSPDSKPLTCYSTVKLCLEPFFDLHQFKSGIQTSPTSQFVQCKDSVWNSVYTQLLNCRVMSMSYTSKLQQQMYNNNNNSIIEAHLELSEQAFERSQYIPLQLKLANHAFANFNISVVKINIELMRRINMVCSMNEQVEGTVVQSAAIVFKSSQEKEQQLFFNYSQLAFDLSNHIQIPIDSVCTIPSASTKNVFSLAYDLMVSLEITGTTSANNFSSLNQEKRYVANQHYHVWKQDELHHKIPSEPYHHKFKTYSLYLDPLPVVVVGNSAF